MNVDKIVSEMSLEEKAALCSGKNFWESAHVERLGLSSVFFSDGPHGLRKQNASGDNLGLSKSIKATCFPTASCIASSFDRKLLRQYGKSLGEQCVAENVDVILGPGVNIKRSPLCGRNFEYFSEDPYLTGEIASNFIKGVQSQKIGVSIKHFAVNNQEKRRMTVSSEVDDRALREIYLRAFEKAVKEQQPYTIMCSYNKINGVSSSENDFLLNKILRDEWGYDGAVISDWGATNNRVDGIKAGLDIEMPSSGTVNTNKIINAVKDGTLSENDLDKVVKRIVALINKAQAPKNENIVYDRNEHLKRAIKFAKESIVLLKNDGVLPLSKDKKIAVIGEFASKPRYQGSGSSRINSYKTIGFLESLYDNENYTYSQGYNTKRDVVDEALEAEAIYNAKNSDVAVVFAGLTDSFESEGFDRTSLEMPSCQNRLIEKICEVQENVVVVLHNGSPITMPWLDKVSAVVECYLAGDGVGIAQKHILFGKTNPSGKLAESFPKSLDDVSCKNNFPGNRNTVEYRESIYVGYRYYDKNDVDVLFPFGFGLSYTEFEYSSIKLSKKTKQNGENLTLSFKIKNVGDYDGAEAAQIYVRPVDSKVFKAEKELKGFEKVFLKKGEEKEIEIVLSDDAFCHYDIASSSWKTESGKYEILVGSSSRDIRLVKPVEVKGDKIDETDVPECYMTGNVQDVSKEDFEALLGRQLPDPDPQIDKITLNDTIECASNSKWGKRVIKLINAVTSTMTSTSMGDGAMLSNVIFETPISKFVTMTGGSFTEESATKLVNILNDDDVSKNFLGILKGLPKMLIDLIK